MIFCHFPLLSSSRFPFPILKQAERAAEGIRTFTLRDGTNIHSQGYFASPLILLADDVTWKRRSQVWRKNVAMEKGFLSWAQTGESTLPVRVAIRGKTFGFLDLERYIISTRGSHEHRWSPWCTVYIANVRVLAPNPNTLSLKASGIALWS